MCGIIMNNFSCVPINAVPLCYILLLQLLLLPDYSSGSAYYAEQAASGDTTLLLLCLPRSVALGGVREECQDIVFALSVEFYGQVFGK